MNFFSSGPNLEKQVFDLKLTSKQFDRMSAKSTKQEKAELLKVKKEMEKGNMDVARIHAQNAIRIRNTATNYLKLASRMDAVAARIDQAIQMKAVTKQMGGVVKGMDKALKSMDMEQIGQVMEQFESSFENLDLASATVENALGGATAASMPEAEVDELLDAVSAEHGLEIANKAAAVGKGAVQMGAAADEHDDALEKRLQALREGAM
ncbi:hypothetical protein EMIHUDRAFT_419528 [Emiliania huxleyi CCMP1516]|uniref:Uncharacterized protein n=2 Tax=Emiliania huxleyi TaxID=2903 RepID=A0A0D3IWX8_EMIH1|nr:hypothetical protein EMIHUDRAFT_419528 [Emiliania huxleyi CCMP1516]EOD15763.1 hypothetical protein EMIHUDRAFT_419528 [Emiliania huxleyi CCMP1516]|mmetsp:Transcript_5077/g.16303  ORF Transcript_5077/g.16303 Transcript_5077/m.16303 type:complete len:208 (+) Transcript_5077:102-725(+)|eukprot:XP_005768192.1 hypothetical protein EMIHUDRAFT_419528 [Emiliania huxleyi CCMP1516]